MSKKSYKSEGKTRVLLNLLSDPAVIIDQKGLFLMANDEFGKETGLNPKELIGKPFLNLDILPAKSKAVLLENLSAKLQGVNVTPYEIQFTNASGEARFIEVKGKIISYAGQPADLVVFHDVTRTKENARRLKEYAERMEALVAEKVKEIKESEEKFRAISTYAKDAIVAADSEGEIVYWNPAAEQIFGYSQEEVVGKSVLNLIIPPRNRGFQQIFVQQVQNRQLSQGKTLEFTALRKDGTEFPAELSAAMMNFENKSCLLGIVRDVSERKKAEMALSESEEKYRNLVENSKDAIAVVDFKGNVLFANKAAEKLTGYTSQEGKGMNIRVITPRRLWPKSLALLLKARFGKAIPYFEYELKRKDGTIIQVETGGQAIFKDGKPVGIQIITRDITERKKAEEVLRMSEEKHRELINGMNDTAWVIGLDGMFIDVNDAAVRVLGYSREELLSMGPWNIDNTLSREQIIDLVTRMPADQIQVFETSHTTKDGKTIPVEISSSLIIYQGKKAILSIARDITERKKTQEDLRVSEERFRAISNSVRDAIILVNDKAEIEYWNPAAEKTFGYTRKEAFGQNVHGLVVPSSMCPEGKMAIKRGIEQFAQTGTGAFIGENVELMGSRKDGSEFPVKLSLSPIKLGSKWHVVGVVKDITEQKQNEQMTREYSGKLEKAIAARTNELQIAQASLLKLERLAAIGEMAGMVGHDLRNPLTGIKNAAYYLEVKQGSCLDDNSKKMLEIIDNAIAHADKIIGDLQDYSREMQLELTNCSPRSILQEALTLMHVPDRVKIVDKTLEKPVIKVDKTKMVRVFMNIIKNAIDAMPKGGTLQIKSTKKKGNVEISFADTGIGIPKENLGKLFSPLVTTKAQGMGFGLAICKRILDAHQGRITVQSIEGKGSTFTLTIPIKPKLEDGGETTWVNLPESLLSTTTKT